MHEFIEREPGHLNVSPPELHGSNMLRGVDVTDEQRLRFFDNVVSFVLQYKIQIHRVGYFRTAAVRKLFAGGDEELRGLCWFGLLTTLQRVLKRHYVVPVMDLCNERERPKYSQLVKDCDIFNSIGRTQDLSLRHTRHLIGEVLYADSRFSVFTQIADVVSYLRHIADGGAAEQRTRFKQHLYEIGRRFDPAIAFEDVITLNVMRSEPS
jgi:hypothetical protein